MCGIAGTISKISQESNIINSLNLLKHRGPNDSGYEKFIFNDKELLLGHTRLSILDLSSAGHQPMSDEKKRDFYSF